MPAFHASHFFRGQFLGDCIARSLEQPFSHAFFCSTCGDIWYRIAVTGQLWVVEPVQCDLHGDGCIACTNINRAYCDASYIDYLPPAAIRREFELTLASYEKESA